MIGSTGSIAVHAGSSLRPSSVTADDSRATGTPRATDDTAGDPGARREPWARAAATWPRRSGTARTETLRRIGRRTVGVYANVGGRRPDGRVARHLRRRVVGRSTGEGRTTLFRGRVPA